MLRFLLFLPCFFTLSLSASAQNKKVLEALQPDSAAFGNLFVKPIYSDKYSSSFVIWIRKEVKLHKHAFHTEQVYVIEGKGVMTLGNIELPIQAGDWVVIPEGTPHRVKVTSKRPLKVLSIQSPQFDGTDRIILEKE